MKIVILGAGRMGSWLAATLAGRSELAVFDTDPAARGRLAGVRCLATREAISAFSPDLLVNAVPLDQTIPAFETVLPFLPSNCALADIASIKGQLGQWYARSGRRFVSTHPMFGPTWTDGMALAGQNAVLIEESDPELKGFWRALYESLGVRVFEAGFRRHDEDAAYALAIPFASSMTFAACMRELDAPGTTFARHLGIARGLLGEDDALLAEIMFNEHVPRQLELIASRLAYLGHIIRGRDRVEMARFLEGLRRNVGLKAAEGGSA